MEEEECRAGEFLEINVCVYVRWGKGFFLCMFSFDPQKSHLVTLSLSCAWMRDSVSHPK